MTPDAWNHQLAGFANAQVFQTHGWGEFKRSAGWQPIRFAAQDHGGHTIALAQALLRTVPGGFKFAWVPGGFPLATASDRTSEMLAGFLACVRARVGRCYVRCNFTFAADAATASAVAGVMTRPAVPLGSGRSVLLGLTGDEESWLKSLTSKHRYYVRKARAAGMDWRYGNDDETLAAMAAMSTQMLQDKKIAVPVFSLEALRQLRELPGDGCRVLVGHAGGIPVTGCTVLRFGARAYFATAATVGRGRELSAAYALIAELRHRLHADGVTTLDFGGIDPASPAARGVDHFKLGFGGTVVEYLGEWEHAASPLHRWLGNLAVRLRRQGL